jgi:EAL domain-containing protein (putative c-di-GMP-specific phosphodiesterase class I)
VLETVCAQVGRWQALDPTGAFRTAWVNVSGRQLARPDFPAVVEAALGRHDLAPTALGLELTESTLIDEAEAPGTELRDIEALGVRVAIDDFGTGYSSLLSLLRYRVDVLKIDGTFVAGLGSSTESTAIIEAVIGLAHTLGMTVSAEGVENSRQLRELRRLECDAACGFLLGRPVSADEVADLVRCAADGAGPADHDGEQPAKGDADQTGCAP